MKKVMLMLFVLVGGLLMISVTAQATAFVNPPETNAPVWVTGFPYQRNIHWDFSVDPTITPQSYNDPSADVHYEGYDDPDLWTSDYVTLNGVSWFDTLDVTSRTGLIGIDNRGGDTQLIGTAIFHIDNWGRDYPWKHIWKEIEFAEQDLITPTSTVIETTNLPEGYEINDARQVVITSLEYPFERQDVWYQITPNPYWEEVVLTFTVDPGAYALVDSLHLATECIDVIPEPASMILLGSLATGLFGAAAVRKRKRS